MVTTTEFNMVHDMGALVIKDDQSWRYGEQPAGTTTVSLALNVFENASDPLKAKYLVGYDDAGTQVAIRSGIPLAKITSGANKGLYGPYDSTADDGRNGKIEGLLESNIPVTVTIKGWAAKVDAVGMRYRGDIITENLPVDVTGAVWAGDFWAVDRSDGSVTMLPHEKPAVSGGGAG